MTCRSREEDFGATTMTGWWFGSGMRNSAPLPWTTWMDQLEGIHHHIARCVPFAVRSRAVLERDNGRLPNGEQVSRLAGEGSWQPPVIVGAAK